MKHDNIYVEKIVSDMEAHCPRGKTVSKDKYNKIATAWLTEIKLAISVIAFNPEENDTRLQLKTIRDKFGYRYTVNGKKEYWLYWFTQNYPLWKEVKKGYSVGGKAMATQIEILFNEVEYFENATPGSLFDIYYRDYINPTNEQEVIWQSYDPVSLEAYIDDCKSRVVTKSKKYSEVVLANLAKAYKILAFTDISKTEEIETFGATQYRCYFPVVQEKSAFGRTYHKGLNLQNAKKEFRAAALGKCTSIDVQASVYGFYHHFLTQIGHKAPYALDQMIDNRKLFREQLAQRVFQNTQNLSQHMKIELIKEALTAIGFGAKPQDHHTNSINKIIMNATDRNLFQNDPKVVELKAVVQVLREAVKTMGLTVEQTKIIKGDDNRINYNKALAYFYQQYEKDIRNKMIKAAEANGGEVLLQTHDGIFVKGGNIQDMKIEIDYAITKKNPICKVELDKQTKFVRKAKVSTEEQEHYNWIAREEKLAENRRI